MFQFKGNRQYLHGTDFYRFSQQLMAQACSDFSHICSLSFRSFATHQCSLSLTAPDEAAISPCKGEAMTQAGEKVSFWWVQTDKPVTERYEFNEERAVHGALINDAKESISTAVQYEYSTIEMVVALTKALHYDFAPKVEGKWVFAQLNATTALPDSYSSLQISLKNYIPNRFSVSRVLIDDAEIGTIRFIVGGP
ncbi:hypothetical protein ACFQ45_13560 [Rhodanobacter aciditrophus]|uniref:Uncharacterized protein n=1 Tax=Rhodanobacter aciditrophus TaxID=1623218 RepID=A0ABW4B570_9GAMM